MIWCFWYFLHCFAWNFRWSPCAGSAGGWQQTSLTETPAAGARRQRKSHYSARGEKLTVLTVELAHHCYSLALVMQRKAQVPHCALQLYSRHRNTITIGALPCTKCERCAKDRNKPGKLYWLICWRSFCPRGCFCVAQGCQTHWFCLANIDLLSKCRFA